MAQAKVSRKGRRELRRKSLTLDRIEDLQGNFRNTILSTALDRMDLNGLRGNKNLQLVQSQAQDPPVGR